MALSTRVATSDQKQQLQQQLGTTSTCPHQLTLLPSIPPTSPGVALRMPRFLVLPCVCPGLGMPCVCL